MRGLLQIPQEFMLTKFDIDDKIRELVKERAATNQGMFDLDDITAELAKFLAEHKHQGRSARYVCGGL